MITKFIIYSPLFNYLHFLFIAYKKQVHVKKSFMPIVTVLQKMQNQSDWRLISYLILTSISLYAFMKESH